MGLIGRCHWQKNAFELIQVFILIIKKNLFFQVKSRVVHTKYGRVQGFGARVGRDAQQQKYVEIFLGIPYASPPIGNNR